MYGGVRGGTNFALVLGLGIFIAATPASAADLGGDCCADLEERIADLEATTARKGNRKVSLEIYGTVNEAAAVVGRWLREQRLRRHQRHCALAFRASGARPRSTRTGRPDTCSRSASSRTGSTRSAIRTSSHGFGNDSSVAHSDDAGFRHRAFSTWFIKSRNYGRLSVGKGDQATEQHHRDQPRQHQQLSRSTTVAGTAASACAAAERRPGDARIARRGHILPHVAASHR